MSDCGSAERASDQVAVQMNRDVARVRSVLADRKQAGIATIPPTASQSVMAGIGVISLRLANEPTAP